MSKRTDRDFEVDDLFELLKARYGHLLSVEEMEEVRRGVEIVVDTALELRALRLSEVDEPAMTFRPYRGKG